MPETSRDEALKILKTNGVQPGKGSSALKDIKQLNFGEAMLHQYSAVIRKP